MDKDKFRLRLDEATKHLIEFTKTLCFNDFVDNFKYIITPNSRTVDNNDEHLNENEISVLESWNKYKNQQLTAEQIVELFYHDGKVPVWVDMTVYETQPNWTIINLFCSRRLREEKDLMHPGVPPFHLQVATPPDHLMNEKSGKFDVNWKKRLYEQRERGTIFSRLKQAFNQLLFK